MVYIILYSVRTMWTIILHKLRETFPDRCGLFTGEEAKPKRC
jgi:hypothetical protein